MTRQFSATATPQDARLLFACAQVGLAPTAILNPALSDPHNGGQCAALFACGDKKYIYKPRSPRTDHAWAEFLDEIAPLIPAPLPRAIRPLTPADAAYTIVPYMENREAADEIEARTYAQRCGALLALCMVLGTTDMHAENVIADGDSPLLADVETLLSGVTPDKAARGVVLYDTLIFSHLLPNWMLIDGENADMGGLTGADKNQLRMHGAPCPLHGYADEVCEGFVRTARGLMENRAAISAALARFADAPLRKLLRPTDLYDRLCRRIAAMDTAEEKQQCAALLRRAYARAGEAWAGKMDRACRSEMDAVLRGDIPYFYCLGGERCLRDVHGVVAEEYFAHAPLDAAKMRLSALTDADIAAQARVIRQSLAAVRPEKTQMRIESARAVFDLLESQAIAGSPSVWMGISTGAKGEAYFQSIGFDLYDGLLGVLGFYAALYEATGDGDVRAALERHYAAYRAWYIEKDFPLTARADNICLTSGLGGHIMLLGYLARTLGEDGYLRDAKTLLARFDFSDYQDRENWDVYSGAGGLLIALPQLLGRGMDEHLSRLAAQLAGLIAGTAPTLTGYAHGAAGLALALGAAQYAGGGDYTEAILRLLIWEDALYDESARNWPDLRDPQQRGFMKGLCSGAPGIGMARMQLLRYVQDTRIRAICEADVARAQAFLAAQDMPLKRDTLCCGNAALVEAARVLCVHALLRLNDMPTLYHPLDTDDFQAGLFQGFAGVGYALARQLPGSRSSIFMMEVEA